MKAYKIGRYPEADIILTTNFCSRDHAVLTVAESGKILLQDYSSNGTTVNGKTVSNQTVEIKFGDEILFAGVEQLDWSRIEKPVTPSAAPAKPSVAIPFIKKNAAKIIGAVVLIGIILAGISVITSPSKSEKEQPLTANEIYNRYKNAVAMVEVKYFVRVDTKAGNLYFGLKDGEHSSSKTKSDLQPYSSEGTAFFIDSNGTLITNHHVLKPWQFSKDLKDFFITQVKPSIKRVLKNKGWGDVEPQFYGEQEALYIYPNGTTFSAENRIACSVVKIADSEEIDLGSIQTNTQTLPTGADVVPSSLIEADEKKIEVNTAAYVIGFPHGDALATNEDNELKCSSTSGSFTQEPAKYYIQYSVQTASGGSGSPVFNQYGKLVAVTYQGSTTGQSFNRGILAKYISVLMGAQ
jgi:V8-like Glu-specific endopeptidase